MTTDEIIKLAHEADPFGEHGRLYQVAELTPETLIRFAEAMIEYARANSRSCATVISRQCGPCRNTCG